VYESDDFRTKLHDLRHLDGRFGNSHIEFPREPEGLRAGSLETQLKQRFRDLGACVVWLTRLRSQVSSKLRNSERFDVFSRRSSRRWKFDPRLSMREGLSAPSRSRQSLVPAAAEDANIRFSVASAGTSDDAEVALPPSIPHLSSELGENVLLSVDATIAVRASVGSPHGLRAREGGR
jgi:hypothetical protein